MQAINVVLRGEEPLKNCPKCFTECEDGARFCPNCGENVGGIHVEDEGLVGKTVAGNFLIQEMIGTGAMGAIYRAEQVSLGKIVAIKVLHRHLLSDPTLIKRFHREARSAGSLKHPNCINIIDFGQAEDGALFIAMEMIDGRDLAEVLFRAYPLSDARIIRIAKQICMALDEAHNAGIIHRDLKPENIMLEQRRNEPDFVKVLDFGIAKLQEVNPKNTGQTFQTVAGVVCGTPEYMSPEQARGEELDGRSDLYSLGVILYQLLCNELPYTADSPIAVVTRHLTDPVPAASEVRSDCNPHLNALAMRLMSKKRTERPEDALALKQELQDIEEGLGHSSTGTLFGSPALTGQAVAPVPSNIERHETLSQDDMPTQFTSAVEIDAAPPQVSTGFGLEVTDTKTSSTLPWALTALLAVALAAYVVMTAPSDDSSPEANAVTQRAQTPTESVTPSPSPPKASSVEPKPTVFKPASEPQAPVIAEGNAKALPVESEAKTAEAMPSSPTKQGGVAAQADTAAIADTSSAAAKKAVKTPKGETLAAAPKAKFRSKKVRPKQARAKKTRKVSAPISDEATVDKKAKIKELLAKARSAKSSGNSSAVVAAYQQAYKLARNRRYLKEIGHAYRKLGKMGAACKFYGRYVRGFKGQARTDAVQRLALYGCSL